MLLVVLTVVETVLVSREDIVKDEIVEESVEGSELARVDDVHGLPVLTCPPAKP